LSQLNKISKTYNSCNKQKNNFNVNNRPSSPIFIRRGLFNNTRKKSVGFENWGEDKNENQVEELDLMEYVSSKKVKKENNDARTQSESLSRFRRSYIPDQKIQTIFLENKDKK